MAESSQAWQPFTPRGVAAFARASLGRLLLLQSIVAVLIAATTLWHLDTGWFPTVQTAIENLPEQGQIRWERLEWHGNTPVMLAEGRFLAVSVDMDHAGTLRSTVPIQIEFGRKSVLVYSLFGYAEGFYPPGLFIGFNSTDLRPRWGAWKPILLAAGGVGAGVGVFLCWWVLATLYFLPVWLAGYFANRDLTLFGSWKLSGAALLPGAVLMLAALLLFGFGAIDLVRFLFVTAVHYLIGWVYLFLSLLFVPQLEAAAGQKKNPFVTQENK